MFARVAPEEFLIEISPDRRNDDVLGRANLFPVLGAARKKCSGLFFGLQIEAIEQVQRRPVDRHGNEFALDASTDAMLIRSPLREAGKILENIFGIGVENVRSILMKENPCIIAAVIGIARNVGPPVDKKDALPGTGGETFRKD